MTKFVLSVAVILIAAVNLLLSPLRIISLAYTLVKRIYTEEGFEQKILTEDNDLLIEKINEEVDGK